jgi:putative membrane protein
MSAKSIHLSLLVIFLASVIWSLINPHDYFTWFLEVFPAFIAAVVLIATYERFRLSTLLYVLICMHGIVLLIGGHYTYAEVPLFSWIRDTYHLSRNHYDRLGHFFQGFVPALVAREILLRKTPLRRGWWLNYIIFSICLSISALYEIFEWRVAVATGSAADAFLGTQGDVWDTQWDMTFAIFGAVTAILFFSKFHDRFLKQGEGLR